jgi:flagella basal body P-ring formation protein FlgA
MSTWIFLLTMLTNPSSCQFVNNEQIFAGDLVKVLPVFSAAPKDAIIGYAPAPGSRRVIQFAELQRIGMRYRIAVPAESEACFEWKLQQIEAEAAQAAMRESMHAPGARIQMLEMSKGLAPEGRLEFPLSGLTASTGIDPSTPVMWRGYVHYAHNHRYSVWARVRLSVTTTRVVAVQQLLPGEPLQAHQVRLETYDDFPLRNDIARTLEEVIGRVPRRTIRQGLPVFRTDLAEPFQVQRGEMVAVTAIAGAAQLGLDAIAEGSGRQGDVISLKNPQSGKKFRARIEGKGKAMLVVGGGSQLSRVQ